MLASLIGGFIIILIGVTLAPIIADSVNTAQYSANATGNKVVATNVTGATFTLVGLVTLFYCIGVMTAGISVAINGLRQAGLM